MSCSVDRGDWGVSSFLLNQFVVLVLVLVLVLSVSETAEDKRKVGDDAEVLEEGANANADTLLVPATARSRTGTNDRLKNIMVSRIVVCFTGYLM